MRNEKLIHALGSCINHCNHCADACLGEENVKMMVKCIRLDRVCAETCAAANQILSTSYKDVQGLLDFCIKVCNECADECEKHEHQHCKDCARACRECADACRQYAA